MAKSSNEEIKPYDCLDYLNEFLLNTYPDLTPKQSLVYKEIIEVVLGVEFTGASYDEVVLRTLLDSHPQGMIFNKELRAKDGTEEYRPFIKELLAKEETKEIKNTIDELCTKGIISSGTTTYETEREDGTIVISGPSKILMLREADKKASLHARSGA